MRIKTYTSRSVCFFESNAHQHTITYRSTLWRVIFAGWQATLWNWYVILLKYATLCYALWLVHMTMKSWISYRNAVHCQMLDMYQKLNRVWWRTYQRMCLYTFRKHGIYLSSLCQHTKYLIICWHATCFLVHAELILKSYAMSTYWHTCHIYLVCWHK